MLSWALMVYLDDWDTFYAEAEKMYIDHPAQTRYVMKYRHCDGKIVLKVTNDRVCLKYQTDQASDVKRLDKLNNVFLTRMCGKDPSEDATEEVAPEKPKSSERDDADKVNSANKKSRKKR
uniref:Signal recognition particle 9 kDa protein n=1 Tax=Prymnesium polylepis TaxID=72548 RepID=A0A7S4IUA7_9EUKA